ncbi:MAG: hypothetical protein ACI8UO_002076 [Verrucomicrobiales bacterium]|jgi:hypothetical protein
MKSVLNYLSAKLVAPREFKAFIEPYREPYEKLKRESSKNYFRKDLGVKGAILRARMLGLHKSKGLKILDVGTGPGMFPAVCDWYGHEPVGGDVPSNHESSLSFGPVCEMFKIDVRPLTIKSPTEGVSEIGGRWDLVTAFLTNFDCGWEGSGCWSAADWKTFIRIIFKDALTPGGRFAVLPVGQNKGPVEEVARDFRNVRQIPRWGVWIFENGEENQ